MVPSLIFTAVFTALLFWLFVFAIAVQCGYALYFFSRVGQLPAAEISSAPPRHQVSVVICAKDEADNLRRNLPVILEQEYRIDETPQFEVLVVNDASEDDTEEVLAALEGRYPHLRHVTISPDTRRSFKGKKFALHTGVNNAAHNWLLFTDADCQPASPDWITHMLAPLEAGKEIAIGYGGHRARGGVLNAFVRWETINTFLQYATYALAGKPYMAVGRNLACVKDAFLKAQSSAAWNKLPSGDDDLLMQAYANATNTAVVAHPDSFTWSEGKNNWKEWLAQKQRHMSTGKYYKKDVMTLLGVYGSAHAAVWILFLLLLFIADTKTVLLLMAMRCFTYWSIWMVTALKLQDRKLLLWIPVFDWGWMIYNFVLSPYVIWKNKQQWK